ncbi:MAG: lytic transglycosylase domain-containing protein [Proteobacteria bacterium]|nr:lytic transglycosylase domain-containing protein [Pseudomonadota bacterium]
MTVWQNICRGFSVVGLSLALGASAASLFGVEAAPGVAPQVDATMTSPPSVEGQAAPSRYGEDLFVRKPSESVDAHSTAEPEATRRAPVVTASPSRSAIGPVYVEAVVRVPVRRAVASSSRRGTLASRGSVGHAITYERRATQLDIAPIIMKHAQLRSLDPHLIKAVIFAESNFRCMATSRCGARGLMQLMPATGYVMGARDLYDPEQNIAAGTRYLRVLLDMYGGRLTPAIAAYNAGPGNVPRSGAVPNITETRGYVKKVLKAYRDFKSEGSTATGD